MGEFMTIAYENDNRIDMYTEHNHSDVIQDINKDNDNLVDENVSGSDMSNDSELDGDSKHDNVDFHIEGEHEVVF